MHKPGESKLQKSSPCGVVCRKESFYTCDDIVRQSFSVTFFPLYSTVFSLPSGMRTMNLRLVSMPG